MRAAHQPIVHLCLLVAALFAACGGGQEPGPLDLGGVSIAADGAVILDGTPLPGVSGNWREMASPR